jgi:NadR type nicotinamide-nucleotide adenylyltransferase
MNISKKTLRIAITGPESSGKTMLAKQLADRFDGLYIPEYAREYVETLHRPYTYDDVEHIAKTQVSQYQETKSASQQLFFFDTWLLITIVWFNWVYGKTPDWLEDRIRECPIDLFLLCSPDLPWEADPVRENGGENRVKLFEQYQKELSYYGFNFVLVSGSGDSRLANAVAAVRDICE